MTDLSIEGFDNREFAVEELTSIINNVPNRFGLCQQLNIFPAAPALSTTFFKLEINNWTLNLLPFTERGAAGTKGRVGKRDVKIFEVPQITHEDSVKVADVQNLRMYGPMAPKMLEDAIGDKLVTMARKHYQTHEWHNITMLRGQMRDADNSVVLDAFTQFGITQGVAHFGGADLNERLRAIKRCIELRLRGDMMTHIVAFASPSYMEMLFANADIRTAYNQAMAAHSMMVAMNPQLADRRFGFVHQEITFYEYIGSAAVLNSDGTETTRTFIPAGEAIFFPMGTQEAAHSYIAPGDFAESVNMPGQLFYAKEAADRFNRSRDLLTQSNRLPFWKRPGLLVKGLTASSGGNISTEGAVS